MEPHHWAIATIVVVALITGADSRIGVVPALAPRQIIVHGVKIMKMLLRITTGIHHADGMSRAKMKDIAVVQDIMNHVGALGSRGEPLKAIHHQVNLTTNRQKIIPLASSNSVPALPPPPSTSHIPTVLLLPLPFRKVMLSISAKPSPRSSLHL